MLEGKEGERGRKKCKEMTVKNSANFLKTSPRWTVTRTPKRFNKLQTQKTYIPSHIIIKNCSKQSDKEENKNLKRSQIKNIHKETKIRIDIDFSLKTMQAKI